MSTVQSKQVEGGDVGGGENPGNAGTISLSKREQTDVAAQLIEGLVLGRGTGLKHEASP